MSPTPSDMQNDDPGQFLPWLVEMGADEVVLDSALNRFAAPVSSVEATPVVASRAPVLAAKSAVNWKAIAAGAQGVAAAEALASSITSLETYLEALDNFEDHPLKKTASRAAAVSGNLTGRLLVLCDKPRNDEDRSGDVLSGNNRVLADKMLAAIGLSAAADATDDAVVLANFIPWRPPGNRVPTEQECLMMQPFLRKLVGLLQPKAILCFGHLPGQYLAGGEEAIMKARGKWLDAGGIPLLPTFHPETLLKSAPSKRLAWHDLLAFRQKLDELP
jgi:uracil-DNA glycosylase